MNKHIELSKQSKKLLFSGITAAALALVVGGPHAVKADSVSGSTLAANSLTEAATKQPVTAFDAKGKTLTPSLTPSKKARPFKAPNGVKGKVTTKASNDVDAWMPDKNLQEVVAYNLYGDAKSVDKITKDDLANLKYLQIFEGGSESKEFYEAALSIKSLKGLEFATSLETIDLGPDTNLNIKYFGMQNILLHSALSDISALAKLTNLESVNFQQSSIYDISALANKPKLTAVYLSYNNITDFSPLGKDPKLDSSNVKGYFQTVEANGYYVSKSSTPTLTLVYNNITGIDGKPMQLRIANDPKGQDKYVRYYASTWNNPGVVNGQQVAWNISGLTPNTGKMLYMTVKYTGSAGEGGWFIVPFMVVD